MKKMNLGSLYGSLVFLAIFIFTNCINKQIESDQKLLVFSKTAGFYHDCIPNGNLAIMDLCKENGISVDTTSNASYFKDENLSKYDAILFFNTTGDVLDGEQERTFERFIQAGGGYVGVHSASDTEYEWNWYGQLVGAYFVSHPKIQEAKYIVKDPKFIATNFLPMEWIRTDELYNLKLVNPDINVVLTVDENSYDGGENGEFHPMSWYQEYDGGRAFYTALGHTKESYSEEFFLRHLLGGIQYAIGDTEK
jgi:cytochrome c